MLKADSLPAEPYEAQNRLEGSYLLQQVFPDLEKYPGLYLQCFIYLPTKQETMHKLKDDN